MENGFKLRNQDREELWQDLNEVYDLLETRSPEFALEKLSAIMHKVRYSE